MRHLFRLPVLALALWIAIAGIFCLPAAMAWAGAWNPHFLPVTVLAAVVVGSGLALGAGGLWRLRRGPGRLRAVTCLLLGAAPLLVLAGYILYGVKAGLGSQLELDPPLKMLALSGESVLDLLTRFQYPVRTEGKAVVMISTPVADAHEQVAAMDRHVRSLWKRLGGKSTARRVHWVRGPIMGISQKAIIGTCLGSLPNESPKGTPGFTWVDRHEVAHCVLASFLTLDLNIDPPAILIEGWAQANMGLSAKAVAIQARDFREQGQALSLRELTGPAWYSLHRTPAYVQGAALVNHILRVYGPARFLDLYATARPRTFAEDCQRVLGVSLETLDAGYWSEVEQAANREGSEIARLRAMKVRPPVSTDDWNRFLDDYVVKSNLLAAPYQHVHLVFEWQYEHRDEYGQPAQTTHTITVLRSGDRAAGRYRRPEGEDVFLATPALSFQAFRRARTDPWQVHYPGMPTAAAHRWALRHIESYDYVRQYPVLLLTYGDQPEPLAGTPDIVVTELERLDAEGQPRVRVRLEDPAPRPARWRSIIIDMVADSLAAQSLQSEWPDGTTRTIQNAYDETAGRCVLAGVSESSSAIKILDCSFGPVPDSEFTEARLLEGPVVHHPVRSARRESRGPRHVRRLVPDPARRVRSGDGLRYRHRSAGRDAAAPPRLTTVPRRRSPSLG